ncbi:ABC transporter substrate-binding protein [Gracilibacillus suaedae]|uniref:ABC transporter substrate-binding protein n=1 Tax=Gracilibacillus suaedae TaxID=2820273 RepID=UPI001ABDCE0F|nr:ABC transporter substrate-binding protein [Gracilibacillus suaedae]
MRKLTYILLFVFILLTACNQETTSDNQAVTAQSEQYRITDFIDREISFHAVPDRIAVLSNGDLNIINALGGNIVGRPDSASDQTSLENFKEMEPIGSTHEIDLEQLTLAQPDVVLGNSQMNQKDIANIESLGAKMVLTNAQSYKNIKQQIKLFGEMLQNEDQANQLINQLDEDMTNIQEQLPQESVRVLLVYGAPGTYMAALPNSLSGNLLELAGGENIASDFPSLEAYPQYAQINTERIIETDPEYIFLISHGNPEEVRDGFMKEMEQNPTWNTMDAVKDNKVEVLPSDLFGTNPGIRVTEAVEYLTNIFNNQQGAA